MKYALTEIFYSIQGEGLRAGHATVFIRMAGCNYHCTWCDTLFPVKAKLMPREIEEQVLDLVNLHAGPDICITGGEPTMHDLEPLLAYFDDNWPDCFKTIETNGSFPDKLEGLRDWAQVTCSPKKPDGRPADEWEGFVDAIKLVYDGQDLSRFRCSGDKYFLQPMAVDDIHLNQENIKRTIAKVKENPKWKLSLQTQKWLNIR